MENQLLVINSGLWEFAVLLQSPALLICIFIAILLKDAEYSTRKEGTPLRDFFHCNARQFLKYLFSKPEICLHSWSWSTASIWKPTFTWKRPFCSRTPSYSCKIFPCSAHTLWSTAGRVSSPSARKKWPSWAIVCLNREVRPYGSKTELRYRRSAHYHYETSPVLGMWSNRRPHLNRQSLKKQITILRPKARWLALYFYCQSAVDLLGLTGSKLNQALHITTRSATRWTISAVIFCTSCWFFIEPTFWLHC